MPRSEIHIALHIIVPLAIAWRFFPKKYWSRAFLLMMMGMLIDLDHLLANPIYAPNRCSIGFHPLHTWPFVLGYFGLLLARCTRLVALGLLIHIALDFIDCIWMKLAG